MADGDLEIPRTTKVYGGDADGSVWIDVHRLDMPEVGAERCGIDPLLHLAPTLPCPLSWGYYGSGPRQLAIAMLYDAIGDQRLAVALAGPFARLTLAGIPGDQPWAMSETVVRALAASLSGRAR